MAHLGFPSSKPLFIGIKLPWHGVLQVLRSTPRFGNNILPLFLAGPRVYWATLSLLKFLLLTSSEPPHSTAAAGSAHAPQAAAYLRSLAVFVFLIRFHPLRLLAWVEVLDLLADFFLTLNYSSVSVEPFAAPFLPVPPKCLILATALHHPIFPFFTPVFFCK